MLGLRKYPGSSGAKKLSIPNWFALVLNTFGRPVRFQFFWFLTTLQLKDRQRQLCRRCLFNIAQACAGKCTLTDTFDKPQNHENRLQKSATLRTSSQVSVQYSPTLCRKPVPNRHLQKNIKIYTFYIKARLARSVWIRFLRACG